MAGLHRRRVPTVKKRCVDLINEKSQREILTASFSRFDEQERQYFNSVCLRKVVSFDNAPHQCGSPAPTNEDHVKHFHFSRDTASVLYRNLQSIYLSEATLQYLLELGRSKALYDEIDLERVLEKWVIVLNDKGLTGHTCLFTGNLAMALDTTTIDRKKFLLDDFIFSNLQKIASNFADLIKGFLSGRIEFKIFVEKFLNYEGLLFWAARHRPGKSRDAVLELCESLSGTPAGSLFMVKRCIAVLSCYCALPDEEDLNDPLYCFYLDILKGDNERISIADAKHVLCYCWKNNYGWLGEIKDLFKPIPSDYKPKQLTELLGGSQIDQYLDHAYMSGRGFYDRSPGRELMRIGWTNFFVKFMKKFLKLSDKKRRHLLALAEQVDVCSENSKYQKNLLDLLRKN